MLHLNTTCLPTLQIPPIHVSGLIEPLLERNESSSQMVGEGGGVQYVCCTFIVIGFKSSRTPGRFLWFRHMQELWYEAWPTLKKHSNYTEILGIDAHPFVFCWFLFLVRGWYSDHLSFSYLIATQNNMPLGQHNLEFDQPVSWSLASCY